MSEKRRKKRVVVHSADQSVNENYGFEKLNAFVIITLVIGFLLANALFLYPILKEKYFSKEDKNEEVSQKESSMIGRDIYKASDKPKKASARSSEAIPGSFKPKGEDERDDDEFDPEFTFLSFRDVNDADLVVKGFTEAENLEKASSFIKNSMNEYAFFKEYYEPGKIVSDFNYISAYEYPGGLKSVFYLLDHEDGKREIQVYSKGGKDFYIDWRSYLLFGSQSFYSYAEDLPEGEVTVMGYLSTEDYFYDQFPENKFVCYLLQDYSGENRIFLYTERNGDNRQKIVDALTRSSLSIRDQEIIRVCLRVKLTTTDLLHTGTIKAVMATNWTDHLK